MSKISYSLGYLRTLKEAGLTTEDAQRSGAAFDAAMHDEPTFEVQIEGGATELLAALRAHGKGFRLRGASKDLDPWV